MMARSCRARSASGGSPSRSATMSSWSLALSQQVWAGELPVDERDRRPVAGDDVPRRDVAVADDAGGPAELAAVPREPDRVRCWLVGGRGLVEIAEELSDGSGTVEAPWPWLGEFPVDVGQRFATIWVKAGADQSRCRVEPDALQVP